MAKSIKNLTAIYGPNSSAENLDEAIARTISFLNHRSSNSDDNAFTCHLINSNMENEMSETYFVLSSEAKALLGQPQQVFRPFKDDSASGGLEPYLNSKGIYLRRGLEIE